MSNSREPALAARLEAGAELQQPVRDVGGAAGRRRHRGRPLRLRLQWLGGVPLVVEKRTGAGSHRRILRGGGDSLIHHLLLGL
jgi:hypothetical protein